MYTRYVLSSALGLPFLLAACGGVGTGSRPPVVELPPSGAVAIPKNRVPAVAQPAMKDFGTMDLSCDQMIYEGVNATSTSSLRAGIDLAHDLQTSERGRLVLQFRARADSGEVHGVHATLRPLGSLDTSAYISSADAKDAALRLEAQAGTYWLRVRCPRCMPVAKEHVFRAGYEDTLIVAFGLSRSVCDPPPPNGGW